MGTNLGPLSLTTGIGRFTSHDINITMIQMAACWLRSEKRKPFGIVCAYETMLLPGTWMLPETLAPATIKHLISQEIRCFSALHLPVKTLCSRGPPGLLTAARTGRINRKILN